MTAISESLLHALDTADAHAPDMEFRPIGVAGADFLEFPGSDIIRAEVLPGMAYAASGSRGVPHAATF